jgi:DNA-binding MarR family transcriptional regulator
MSVDDLNSALDNLFAAQRRMRGRDQQVKDTLSYAQYRMLRALARSDEPSLPSGKLAALGELTPATVTEMTASLERAGIVKRERSKRDRRVVTIALTDEGRARYDRKTAALRKNWRRTLRGLDQEELIKAASILALIAQYLDGM